MINFEGALETLTKNDVKFIIVEGLAVSAYGSAHITTDLDFCYQRTEANYANIVTALKPYNPELRGAPADLPFLFDPETISIDGSFTLATDLGDMNLLSEIAGVGTYEDADADAIAMSIMGFNLKILSLPDLINAKRAAGRTKDLLVLPELEAFLEIQLERSEKNSE